MHQEQVLIKCISNTMSNVLEQDYLSLIVLIQEIHIQKIGWEGRSDEKGEKLYQ